MTQSVNLSTRPAPMNPEPGGLRLRSVSRVVAVLFVTTMLAGMVDAYAVAPRLEAASHIDAALATRLVVGALCVIFMAIGVVGIATTLYPVLRPHGEAVAVTYVAFRAMEGVLLSAGAVGYLALASGDVGLGQDSFAAAAAWVISVKEVSFLVAMTLLGIGGTLMCRLLGTSGLTPRWLSWWGVLGYVSLLVSAVLGLARVGGATADLLYVVGGVWELVVFPGWLLATGLRTVRTDGPEPGRSIQH